MFYSRHNPKSFCLTFGVQVTVSGGGHVLQRLLPSRHLRLSDILKKIAILLIFKGIAIAFANLFAYICIAIK